MKLSASLTIALLSHQNVAAASPAAGGSGLASASIGVHTLQRMLARKEDNGHLLERELQKGNGGGNKGVGGGNKGGDGGNKGNGGGGGGDKTTGGGRSGGFKHGGDAVGPPGRGKNKHSGKSHSAAMDKNDSGVSTNEVEYYYGEKIDVSFKLTNDLVSEARRMTMDLTKMNDWSLGIFMRMADPQDGDLAPIESVKPTIQGARRMQDKGPVEEETAGTRQETDEEEETETTTTVPTVPPEPQEPVTLNHVGSGTFTATSANATELSDDEHGTGFDIYLLDEDGAAIIGPATFYMLKTQDMVEAEEAAEAAAKPDWTLYDHGRKKGKKLPKTSGGGGGGVGVSVLGGGKGGGSSKGDGTGKKQIIAAAQALADYTLTTDLLTYELGDNVTVTYDLGDMPAASGRRLQKGRVGGGEDRNGGGKGGGNGGGDDETTATEAPPRGGNGGGDGGGNGGGNEDDPFATTTTTTQAPRDGPDAGAVDEDIVDGEFVGTGLEEQPDREIIDEMDVTLYKMGVFMRMANPQDGKVQPIIACDVEKLMKGTFSFNTNDLNVGKYGYGFDVWILNGAGGGMAGPHSFYIETPDDE